MRKSINVETVFGTLTKEVLAKGWKARIGDWLSFLSSSAFGSEQWKMYETAIKADIEFAKANIELLSEEDYKWLLGYTSGLTLVSTDTVDSTNDVTPSFNCKICCDGHFSASDVQGKTIKSDVEVIAAFKKLIPGFTAAAAKLKVGDAVATESQKKLWVVQITKGKKVWYKTSGSFKDGYVSPSIDDASLYYTKADAAYFATFIKPGNTRIYNLPFPVKVMLKEVVYTENASRTVELVKPVDSTVKKVRKPKVKEEWVLYQVVGTHPYYYIAPTNKVTPLLRNATSYPSYAKAANANYNLIKAGEKSFIVEERKNCK